MTDYRDVGPKILTYMREQWPLLTGHTMAAVLLGIVYGQFEPSMPDTPGKRQRFIQYLANLLQ